MAGEYLLDTNVLVDLLRGDTGISSRLSQLNEIVIPVIVIGELILWSE